MSVQQDDFDGRLNRHLRRGIATGAGAALVAVYLSSVGLLAMMNARPVIANVLTLAQTALLAIAFLAGLISQRSSSKNPAPAFWTAPLAGLVAGLLVAGFASLILGVNLRSIFIALTPPLARLLTFGQTGISGTVLLAAGSVAVASAGALYQRLPQKVRRLMFPAALAVLLCGMFQEFIQVILQSNALFRWFAPWFYGWDGLTGRGGLTIFAIALVVAALPLLLRKPGGFAGGTGGHPWQRPMPALLMLLLLLLVPIAGGPYIAQVFLLIGLYVLMGMGLNLELGLAGLLDLGFVAFFATGAYITAILTADSPLALAHYTAVPSFSFWAAMPIAVLGAVLMGILFGIPVLGVKGDYLAVATLGLGEIVRIVVQSDAAAPLLGGAQGILQIPKPQVGGFQFGSAVSLFYLTLAAAIFAAYCAWRLERSRLGRAWIALREDEDVAQAMGINLVQSKLLAYAFGAAFAGLAGSIFAVMVNSVFPSSFQLLMSINVLALIVVGGLGSLSGVVLGALVLIGLPEALREFGEFRYLFYGLALILTMRLMPEGLWPAGHRRRRIVAPMAGAQGVRATRP
ncbi:branched-chain amino acid ABC transporter permease [Mesorhizobium sp. VK25A]|uniref:Branched-chain amino acid ABC transporter permease n=1 Tax=Mesorhizobium vachelliae TaxID=3072309 RepID=A0ABU5A6D5_9HYPH|nr:MULTISPECIES: branched-chain amino acid ABC transporter permease [unclassified Mesorhizobium]MDX8533271.1 branched-chain amino acid ABC transporter permease [Mesorhizobium sp. VK25D]MDX8545190.1 branched-chain amino acid ABC transporter permease [Mesorhizobium sp. VK25A]